MRLSDAIEEFIKDLFVDTDEFVQLQRNQLAEHFGCAPSQINYVLSTRFTTDHGYFIKSKRGGGGCIIIYKIEDDLIKLLSYLINDRIGESINESCCINIVSNLYEKGIISSREKSIIANALSDKVFSLINDKVLVSNLRARIFRTILMEICSFSEVK